MNMKEPLKLFFAFCHKCGVIFISELIDISPRNLDSSLCFIQPGISHDVLCMMFKLVLEKAEEPEIKLPTSVGSQKKQENSRKTSTSPSLTTLKPFYCMDHSKLENSGRDGNTRPPYLPPEESVCRSRSNSQNCWNKILVPDKERSTSRLYIVTLLI